MVDTPFAAAALAVAPATLGVGLHVVLSPDLDQAGARAELERQLERFQRLRGAPPTHLDSHKHAHARPAILRAFGEVAAARRLPVRAIDAGMRAALRGWGVATADRFLGDAARRPAWDEASLAAALAGLEDGLTELMAHPGHAPTHARTSFGVEREIELDALTSPLCRVALASSGAVLCAYGHLG
jgi:hypothetical protein